MAEEINYASVVFQTPSNPPRKEKKEEETVYDEVKGKTQTTKQAEDTNGSQGSAGANPSALQSRATISSDKNADGRRRCQLLPCALGILCVILLLSLIAVCVHIFLHKHNNEELKLKENQTTLLEIIHNLTDRNSKLDSDKENLTSIFNNLTQAKNDLEIKFLNLTAEIKQLNTEKKQLNATIQDLETRWNNREAEWNEENATRAQWNLNRYCYGPNNNKQCHGCEYGWVSHQDSCYVFRNAPTDDQKSWDEAQKNCREKNSDLAVVNNQQEKTNLYNAPYGQTGFWIGLRAEDDRWKWLNGSDLNNSSWVQGNANDGMCVISVPKSGWRSEHCSSKKQWICKKKALSV